MALTAKFIADFDSFYDAVQKADAKVVQFASDTGKIGTSLNKMVDSFSGRKLIEDATLMAKAIEEVGGAAKLTEKDLARIGPTMNEAVAKMRAIGEKVPEDMQRIADATKNVNKSSIDWMGTLTNMAATIGIAFSAQAVVGFIASVFDAAGKVHDLAKEWGVSSEAAQKFSQAAVLTGSSAEDVGKALGKMQQQLGEGSKNYQAAMESLGLSMKNLQQLDPETAFRQIITAIAGIADPMQQADAAVQAFGKGGLALLPSIRDGFLDVADAQQVMSNETVDRLEAAGDAWQAFKDKVTIVTGEMIGTLMKNWSVIFASWGNFWTNLKIVTLEGKDAQTKWINEQIAATEATTKAKAPVEATTKAVDAHGKAHKTAAEILEEYKKRDDAATQADKDRKKAVDDIKKSADAYDKSLASLVDQFSGGGLIDKADLWVAALKKSIPISQMTADQQAAINKVMGDAIDAYEAMGGVAETEMYRIYAATLKPVTETGNLLDAIKTLGKEGPPVFAALLKPLQEIDITKAAAQIGSEAGPAYSHSLSSSIQSTLGNIPNLIIDTMKGGGSLSGAVIALGSQIGQDFANAVAERIKAAKLSGSGGVFTGTNVAQSGAAGAMAGVGAMAGGASVGQSIGSVAGMGMSVAVMGGMTTGAIALGAATMGIGTAAVFAYYGIKKLIASAKDRKETNKLREDFIDLGGGLAAVNEQAYKAGTSLDALLGAKTADQAKAALEQLQASFEFQKAALDDVNATAQKYGFTLEELGPALQRQALEQQAQDLFKDFEVLNAAGIDSVAIISRMSGATSEYINTAIKMGVEVPSAMQPMLEDMVKAGKLTDANGNAITDLTDSGVKFSLTMTEGFTKMIASVDKLADVISRSLGVALDDTNSKIKSIPKDLKVNVDFHRTVSGEDPGKSGGSEALEGLSRGTDGYRNWGAGTPVILHGWEAVVPKPDSGSSAEMPMLMPPSAPAAAPSLTVVVNAQGAFFDTPEGQQRLADKVSRALTARYGLSNKIRAA
jgi:hypothetical protein